MKWRSIDTPPKYGENVLVFGRKAGEINGISDGYHIGVARLTGQGDYAGFDFTGCHTDAYAVWWQPLYWQPLPKTPYEVMAED